MEYRRQRQMCIRDSHYSATVTSGQFSGKSKIEQHKMVYNSLKGKMGNELHALAIKTKEQ